MASVKEHYDNFLAPFYSWICGGAEKRFAQNRQFFQSYGIVPTLSGIAVDLGAGSGFQSIPLAQSGFKVIAIDLSRDLLTELKAKAEGLSIAPIEDDLLNFTDHIPPAVELIVCMGDTLTHLQSLADIQALTEAIFQALSDNGHLILDFRDLTPELKKLDRFVPVRSDANTIFSCFLEYQKHHVRVHDIVYELSGEQWVMKKSAYCKLRIAPRWMKDCLLKTGFSVERLEMSNGMVMIAARKPTGRPVQ